MEYYIIETPIGNRFIVNENGYITQYEVGRYNYTFSREWSVAGIKHTKKNLFIPWKELIQRLEQGEMINWLYKTSHNPQYTIMDIDYGTNREWGNTKYHGIEKIYHLLDSNKIVEK